MTEKEFDSGNSLVSFTITLPQKFADEITQRATRREIQAEELLQREIIRYMERKERILNEIRKREETRTRESKEKHIYRILHQERYIHK